MTFYAFSALVNALTSLILGFIILCKKKSNLNISFVLFCFSVAFWSVAYFLWQITNNALSALLWCKILTIFSILIPLFYLRFTLFYLEVDKIIYNKILLYSGYLFVVFLVFISPSTLLVKDISSKLTFKFWPEAGSLYWLFLLMFFGFVVYSVSLFIINHRYAIGAKKQQIKFLILGTGVGFLGGSTNFFLWYDIPILPIGNILVSLYVILTAYAIVAHRLMDIKLAMRRSSVYLMSLSVILLLAIAVKYFVNIYFLEFAVLFDFLILVAAVYFFPILRKYFYKIANKYLFSSLYDSREVIGRLSEKLRSTLETSSIYKYISETLEGAFHSMAIGILAYNEKKGEYRVKYNHGFDAGGQKNFAGEKKLHQLFIGQNKSIVMEEVKQSGLPIGAAGRKTIKLLDKMKVEILTPLNIKDKTIGLIALGAKESGDMYNDEDLQVLEVVGAQAAIAIENALLYEETKNFSVKLEKEVEKATKDLRRANRQLKKLDTAKSEFISIASHQLRTPLTVIKGYISMMLEGSFGELNEKEEEPLEKVFESNERLIQLVENLLNISRIESGRLQFDFKQTDFTKMIASVVDELSNYAKKKKVNLVYRKTVKNMPHLAIDGEKIRQVVMNLIDNAIKYTNNKEGLVEVGAEEVDGRVKFCVADNGMGISEKDLPNLFKKFSRGSGTSLVHTEGTGLGLFVARMMIEGHKGRIWAESKGEGRGSKFCFELPIK